MSTPQDLSPEERLRIQNELTKSDLADRHGAEFGFVAKNSADFTPEMEKQFLENIARIEKGGVDAYVPIGSLLSPAAIEEADAIAKQGKWKEACADLLNSLMAAGVMTEQPDWITPQGWYNFLRTDFLDHAVPQPPPMQEGAPQRQMVGAFYDQVRQDSPETMMIIASELLLDILNVTEAFGSAEVFADQVRNGQELQTREEAVAKIEAWRNKWSSVEPGGFNPGGPMRGPDGATYVAFECSFNATPKANGSDSNTGKVTLYDGDGVVQFVSAGKSVKVAGLMMPGFEL